MNEIRCSSGNEKKGRGGAVRCKFEYFWRQQSEMRRKVAS
jgi:hypothetical protein